jgi:hypothetical protein
VKPRGVLDAIAERHEIADLAGIAAEGMRVSL